MKPETLSDKILDEFHRNNDHFEEKSKGCGKVVLQIGKKKWYCGDSRFQLCESCKKFKPKGGVE